MIYLEHLLEATGGVLLAPGKQTYFDAFSHDTRQLIPGELFVAVRGERGDGHDHLSEALDRGAGGLLIENHILAGLPSETQTTLAQASAACIVVPDTRAALRQYARTILERWHPTVIAVSGSTGKTSTKEAIASVLAGSFATFKSWQNYNDLLGLPLSLGRLEPRHEYAVVEFGCDRPGEIAELCQLARPQIGVLTNISPVQLQYFGTLDLLAEELGTILTCLPADGIAIFNQDDERVRALGKAISAGTQQPFAPSKAQNLQITWSGTSARFAPVEEATETLQLASHLLGEHQLTTMLAAYYVGRACGLRDAEILPTLAQIAPLPGRLQPLAGLYQSLLLDDTHNAAPASVLAGLRTLHTLPARRRIAILGDMLSLGDFEEEAHRLIGEKAAGLVDYLITRGERAGLSAEAARQAGLPAERIIRTSTHEDAARAALRLLEGHERLEQRNGQRTTILIKGSEGARMERVTELLLAQTATAPEHLVRQNPGWKQIVMMRAERPTWVEVDLSAIANNTRRLTEIVGPRVRLLASLKADAYGHGALKVARTVLLNGVSMLGVAAVSEARPLREAGINAPILIFGYIPPWQMREAVRLDVSVTLYTLEAAQALQRATQALGRRVQVHVKVDTGMSRLGIQAAQIDEIMKLVRTINQLPGLVLEGIFTHFAMADSLDQTHARKQLARFQQVLHTLDAEGLRPPLVHAANSAGLLSLPEAHFDMVRPGIALFGLDPSADVRLPAGFRPALTFKTQVAQVKLVPTGEAVSYGCTFVAERPTLIAVLPVGYADGFRRGPTNWGSVLLHGQAAPILGRVCMDQCMIDVSKIPQVRAGDEVVLIGQQGEASLSAEEVAQRLGTINYEVVSEILARVPRID